MRLVIGLELIILLASYASTTTNSVQTPSSYRGTPVSSLLNAWGQPYHTIKKAL